MKVVFDLIQRFEVEDGLPHLVSTNIQTIQGGKDLMSLATSMLAQLSFDRKFEANRTSQYTGYRSKNPGKGAKRYQLVLAQRKEGLYISIPQNFLEPHLLKLELYGDGFEENEMGYLDVAPVKYSKLYWVRPSREDIFLEISQEYKEILGGESVGTFELDPKGIDAEDVIHNSNMGTRFKLKPSKDSSIGYYFDHGDYLDLLNNSDCCLNVSSDTLFPYTWQVSINSSEVLEEFIGYFAKILMENQ